jgi:hypothetical protein
MKSSAIVAAVAALVAAAAVAQGPPPAPDQTQRTGRPPMDVPPVNGAPGGNAGTRAPVLKITSVEIIRTSHAPVLDIVRVRGLTSSPGWEEGELIPLTRAVPADGVLQLLFVARAPEEAVEASEFEPIEAIFPLESEHPFKGVNVHGATDAVAVTGIPGYAESKPTLVDCGKCVGKTFVAKGAAGAGRAGEVVREEQLGNVRVIRPSDGIAGADSDPNRLTLILNKDGRISTAVWE